jgi:hypothetical protein
LQQKTTQVLSQNEQSVTRFGQILGGGCLLELVGQGFDFLQRLKVVFIKGINPMSLS